MRINKFIANSGIASRRKADELVANGNVKVNGVALREPGYDIQDGDVVEVNGRVIHSEDNKIYIMVNKPRGMVTTMQDERERPTVAMLVEDVPQRVFPVGRLDFNTTGLLLMTNDGDIANKLAHPTHEIGKTYRAKVAGVLSKEKIRKLTKGIDIGGFVTGPAQVNVLKQTAKSAVVDITIHEGKNHQVRKMFKAVDCPVQELQRIAIGQLYLSRLQEGHYRKLTKKEIDYLKNL